MEITESPLLTTILIVTLSVAVTALIAFLSGKKAGIQQEKTKWSEVEKNYNKNLILKESRNTELQREIENVKRENEKYINFLIKVPEMVKKLSTDLTFDEIVSSIIRLTKILTDAQAIELYMFNGETNSLELVSAFGSNKKQKIIIKCGEGVVGKSAESRMMLSRTALHHPGVDDNIDIAAPIFFKDRLIGAIGLGNIKTSSGNEKRFIAMVADLAGVFLQNCEYLETAREKAYTDPLTGLYNRRYFFERAIEASQKALNYNFPLSFFIFDIDHFKKYNDLNGHTEGDHLLKELSRLLKDHSRGMDVIARYGGEEFIALLQDTDKDGAIKYAEKIRKLIENYPFRHKEKQPSGYVSVSGGVATFPNDGDTIDTVVRHADEALYSAKRSGRNKVTRYEPFQFSA
jgi:diguanylate cyclase (GGDEF)-like protein